MTVSWGRSVNIEKLLKLRDNRRIRQGEKPKPFSTVHEEVMKCVYAGNAIVDGTIVSDHVDLIERSVVISSVSAIEVYFRDMLDFVFQYCEQDFFIPHLKTLHQNKYEITDLIEVHRHGIHPLEIISADMSFQSSEKIEKIFSKFLGRSLWGAVLDQRVRIKDNTESEVSFRHEEFEGLKRVFTLRHQLVHDPIRVKFLTEAIMGDIMGALFMIFGADVILSDMIARNVDPLLKKEFEGDKRLS